MEFTTYIEIAGHEVTATVFGDYQPPEAQISTYPGCEASATIGSVEAVKDGHIIDILPLLHIDTIDGLRMELMELGAVRENSRRRGKSFQQIAQEEQRRALAESENQRGVKP